MRALRFVLPAAAVLLGGIPASAPAATLTRPVRAPPAINAASAGAEVSIPFDASVTDASKLIGRSVPISHRYGCSSRRVTADSAVLGAPLSAATLTHTPGARRYVYRWSTREAWAGKCRRLRIALADGTTVVALFRFENFRFDGPSRHRFNEATAPSTVGVRFVAGPAMTPLLVSAPRSEPTSCVTGAPVGPSSPAAGSAPSRDPKTGAFTFLWSVPAAYAGTCRRLLLTLGPFTTSVQVASYHFANTQPGGGSTPTPTPPTPIDETPVPPVPPTPPANRAPVAVDDGGAGFATDEDTPVTTASLLANDSDPDGDPLTVQSVTATTLGGTAVKRSDGKVDYTPSAGFQSLDAGESAIDEFGYTISDGNGHTASATAAVAVNGVNDAPTVTGGTASLPENSANGTFVRTVPVVDSEPGQTHTFSIVAGNGSGAFAIDPTTGAITVADVTTLDFETTPTFTLTVRATDSGTPALHDDATVTVDLTDVNEAPTATGGSVSLPENSANGTAVTTVTATDPDAGQTHTFSITAGNSSGAFAIDPTTGALTVADVTKLDFETTPTFTLTVRATDDGTPALHDDATVSVNLTDVVEAPTASAATTTVKEAALSTGSNPSSTSESSTGNLTYAFPGEGPAAVLPFTWSTSPVVTDPETASAVSLASDGVPVTWSVSPDGLTLTGSASAQQVLKVELVDVDTGTYKVTLLGPLDDPDANQTGTNDPLLISVPYTVKDADGDTASSTLAVTVDDDGPDAQAENISITRDPVENTNLMLIVDVSGSTADDSGLTGLTRLDVMKAALEELMKRYEERGNVAVRIITFSSTASAQGGTWASPASALPFIRSLTSGGNTNYDAALAAARAAFPSSGRIAGAASVSYFISDGEPVPASAGLDPLETASWQSFLSANRINSIVVGVGSDPAHSTLDPIAYNGETGTESNAFIVSDFSNVVDLPVDTLDPVGAGEAIALGSLFDTGAPGADQPGYLRSVSVPGGATYTYDPSSDVVRPVGSPAAYTFNTATNVLTFTTGARASMSVDMDSGDYSYNGSTAPDGTDSIGFTRSDADGDTASATLSVTIDQGDTPPIARADRVVTNFSGPGFAIPIPDAWLLANDSDRQDDALSITGVSGATSGTVAHSGDVTTFTDNSGSDGGMFTYTAFAGGSTDTADVTVDRSQVGNSTLNGAGFGDILIGRATVDTINGYEGDDVIDGGPGNDAITPGAGNDSVEYTSTLDGTDTVSGFDGDPSGGQDTLDLDALFDSLGVPAASRAGRVQIVDNGGTVSVKVNANTSNPDFELPVATLTTADAVTVGQDVLVGS